MSHRKPRYGLTELPQHVRYREDLDKSDGSTVTRVGRTFKAFFEEENVRSKEYWNVVWHSFWKPFKRHALNSNVVWSCSLAAAAGLGLGYYFGINPDLFGRGAKAYLKPPEQMVNDFNDLKQQLGLGNANINLMVTRDGKSSVFSEFSNPYTFGSPFLSRGATVCIPRVFLEPVKEKKRNSLKPLVIGGTTFEWDTVNGQAGRQLLVLPRDELRFVMGKGLVLANEHYEFKRWAAVPVVGSVVMFLYQGFLAPGLEFMEIVPRSKFVLAIRICLLAYGGLVLFNYFFVKFIKTEIDAERKVAALARQLRTAGIEYLERLAAFRILMRMELGVYATKYINADGELTELRDELEVRAKLLKLDEPLQFHP